MCDLVLTNDQTESLGLSTKINLSQAKHVTQYMCSNTFYTDILTHQGSASQAASNLGKLGVPRPVTGSQPIVALYPLVPHPGLSPIVMSLKAPANAEE